jgi:hypothetical protein
MPKLNGGSENILYLIALAKGKFVGPTAFFFEGIPLI